MARSSYYEPRAETPVSPLLPAFPIPKSSNAHLRHQAARPGDAFDMSPHLYGSPNMAARSPSISSYSSTSQWTSGMPANPSNVHPAPAYVAAFGASQVVSERKRRFSDDDDEGGGGGTAMSSRDDMQFSQNALALVNAFLDQLLYSFLGNAMSTSLTALRPAVRDVLRSRLATEAIASAEEELQELLAGGDEEEEEMNQRQTVAERNRKWDTELVWKRTRLRVMVYTRLGEMEDDDEERYVREDELFHGSDRRFSHSSGLVSWAAAIFLTSVLEYIAEQVLQVAGHAADSRARRQSKNPRVSMSASGMVTPVDGVTVEDHDMEKVALNSTLGRLWRTWRKSLRGGNSNPPHAPPTPTTAASNNNNFSRRFSRDPFGAAMSPRRSSFGTAGPESVVSALDESRRPSMSTNNDRGSPSAGDDELPEAQYPEHVLAANIPLPIGDAKRDVDEIEVPGLARDPDELETHEELTPMDSEPKRRNSHHAGATPFSLIGSLIGGAMYMTGRSRRDSSQTTIQEKPILTRQRSASVPTRAKPVQREEKAKDETDETQDPEAADVTAEAETEEKDDKPEEKANAAEMEPRKRDDSPHVKPVLDKLAANAPPDDDAEKKEARGILGSAAAGSAAAAAAALALVYGPKFDKKEARKSSPAKDTDIEERDKQKHLIDMKRFSVPPSGSRVVQPEKDDEVEKDAESKPAVPKTVLRPATADSDESFSLNDKNETEVVQQPLAKPRHLSGDFTPVEVEEEKAAEEEEPVEEEEPPVDIGVARTSDTAVSTPRTEEPPVEYHQARDSFTNPAPRRPSRLILGANEPDEPSPLRKESQNVQEEDTGIPEVTPESFLSKRSLSLTVSPKQQVEKSKSQPPPQNRSLRESPKRASVPSALVLSPDGGSHGPVSPAFEKTPSPWRQSFAAPEKSSQWAYSPKKPMSVSEPSPTIQEHPVIQKIMKRQENKVREEEESKVLTSASIKGPEDFEMFVQGGDTVKYTLTPENVRDDPSQADAVLYPKTTRNVERVAPSPPPKQSPPLDSRMGRSQTSKQATSANPIAIPPEPEDEREEETSRERESRREKRRSISRPPVRNTSIHRKSGLVAREPQVMTESTRDFADFIRSTGPNKEQEVLPILNNRSTTSLNSLRQAHINGSRSSSPGAASARSLNRTALHSENVPPVPPMPNKGKNSIMQPRGPASTADGTSELIDFIRTGPNGSEQAGQPRQHRISRTVAPFRTTMDSDQFNEWGERLAAQPDLKLNTSVPSAPSVKSASSMKSSVRTSANSRAPLLNGSNAGETVHPAHSGVPQRSSSLSAPDASPKPLQTTTSEPAVKRYRNKDPYALDFDDEDDDLLTALPRNRREEESLIDFLRHSEPPANNYPRGMNNTNGTSSPQTANKGAPRRGSTPGLQTHGADAVSMGPRRGSMPNRDGPQPTNKTANSSAPRQPQGTTTIAVGPITKPRPRMEARTNTATRDAGTTDLADFLRSSGPPPSSNHASSGPGTGMTTRGHSSKTSITSDKASKKSGRRSLFGGLFSRNSAPKQRGYLDM
ncbi:hypothetical protein M409DRAFT_20517 [Zasmidium cellare ATCC 36951]|uniref:Uncharacterized protein n=1 Tax=Zasmidium cellare ATCC 36951 TaxID=1080233 RepID=A0A6A6CQE5_ZASCE|nr:uncharacterized protein M409DRAFT_20517 [Zasmidium cellare ATCC 36951]KAF2169291.1 hypothetical protein M409DRAFT_20517 [Zasmidium cellare ATCC 36951]